MADIVQICDAVVDVLNGASLTETFTAERAYIKVRDIASCGLSVTVFPLTLDVAAWDLKPRRRFDWEVGILIEKKTGREVEDVDPMLGLAEGIIDLFQPGTTLEGMQAEIQGVLNEPVYSPDRMDEDGIFEGMITVTFRVKR